jgi:hypothetical protein
MIESVKKAFEFLIPKAKKNVSLDDSDPHGNR